MSVSKSKCWYSSNCLHSLNRAVQLSNDPKFGVLIQPPMAPGKCGKNYFFTIRVKILNFSKTNLKKYFNIQCNTSKPDRGMPFFIVLIGCRQNVLG
jgi:hypothetical protein